MEGDVWNEGVFTMNSEHVLVLGGCDTTFSELVIPVDNDGIRAPSSLLLNSFESVAIYVRMTHI